MFRVEELAANLMAPDNKTTPVLQEQGEVESSVEDDGTTTHTSSFCEQLVPIWEVEELDAPSSMSSPSLSQGSWGCMVLMSQCFALMKTPAGNLCVSIWWSFFKMLLTPRLTIELRLWLLPLSCCQLGLALVRLMPCIFNTNKHMLMRAFYWISCSYYVGSGWEMQCLTATKLWWNLSFRYVHINLVLPVDLSPVCVFFVPNLKRINRIWLVRVAYVCKLQLRRVAWPFRLCSCQCALWGFHLFTGWRGKLLSTVFLGWRLRQGLSHQMRWWW